MKYRTGCAIFLITAGLFAQASNPAGSGGSDRSIDFPLYLNADGFRSVLTLMNNSTAEMRVSITAFNRRGESRQLASRVVPMGSPVRIDLAEELQAAPKSFESGNLRCSYSGPADHLTGQISITDPASRIGFEVEEAMAGMSSRLVAVAAAPTERANGIAALTNLSSHPIQVSLGQHGHRKLRLDPRETQMLKGAELAEMKPGRPVLLDFRYDGLPGEIAAIGAVFDRKTGYSSTIVFTDPGEAMSNTLAGAHFYSGPAPEGLGLARGTRFGGVLALANTTSSPTQAVVSVDYTLDKRATRVQIAEVYLEGGQAKEVDVTARLKALGVDKVDEAGIDVSYNGAPGGVIGALASSDASGDLAFDTPVKDPMAGMYRSSGAHPWRIDAGYNTVVTLKNVLPKAVNAMVVLRYDGGQYAFPRVDLAPFQTVSIDIRKALAEGKKDLDDNPVPWQKMGKVLWFQEEPDSLIGRAEVFDVRTGVAGSFSCFYPCNCLRPYFSPNFSDTYFFPSAFTLSYLGTRVIATNRRRYDCNGSLAGTFDISTSTAYSSRNTSILRFVSNTVQAVGIGLAQIDGSTTRNTDTPGSCPVQSPANPGGNGTTKVDVSLTQSQATYSMNRQNGSADVTVSVSASGDAITAAGGSVVVDVSMSVANPSQINLSAGGNGKSQTVTLTPTGASGNVMLSLATSSQNHTAGTLTVTSTATAQNANNTNIVGSPKTATVSVP